MSPQRTTDVVMMVPMMAMTAGCKHRNCSITQCAGLYRKPAAADLLLIYNHDGLEEILRGDRGKSPAYAFNALGFAIVAAPKKDQTRTGCSDGGK